MNEYQEIRGLLAGLYEGEESGGHLCPFCRGGRHGEHTLSVKRLSTGGVYVCHRASCGRRGRIDGGAGFHDNVTKKSEFEPRRYTGSLVPLPDAAYEYYWTKYGISESDLGYVAWSPEYERTVWQVLDSRTYLRGYELRAIDDRKPKTLHYRQVDEPWVGWFRDYPKDETIVIVEDVISAFKVSKVFASVSLMGTHLNLEKLLDVLEVSDDIVLALDRDATNKALEYSKRWAMLAPSIKVLPLERDLKLETIEEIERKVRGVL